MHGKPRNKQEISVFQRMLPAIDPGQCRAAPHQEDLHHLAVAMRRDRPVMQPRTVDDALAMHHVRKGGGLAEKVEVGNDPAVFHA